MLLKSGRGRGAAQVRMADYSGQAARMPKAEI